MTDDGARPPFRLVVEQICSRCKGRGWWDREPCGRCEADGWERDILQPDDYLRLTIPKEPPVHGWDGVGNLIELDGAYLAIPWPDPWHGRRRWVT